MAILNRPDLNRSFVFQVAVISEDTSGDKTIIAAPAAGSRIHIVEIRIESNGGDEEVVLKSGTTAISGVIGLRNSTHHTAFDYHGEAGTRVKILGDAEAFVMNVVIGGSNVDGEVSYYVG